MATIGAHDQNQSASTRVAVWQWTIDYATENPFGGGFDAYRGNTFTYRLPVVAQQGNTTAVEYKQVEDKARAYHSAIFEMLGELDVSCSRVSVTELRENTFYASITLTVNGREVEIDSRPSDALALAVRSGAPIFAAEDVIAESAIEFEHEVEDTEEVVDKFKEFLDQVSPEDFQGGGD